MHTYTHYIGTQWSAKYHDNPVFTSPELQDIAKKHSLTIAQVVISWVLQSGLAAIPRTSGIDHLKELSVFLPRYA